MADSLNKRQKQSVADLDEITHLVGIDYWNIPGLKPQYRTGVLLSITRDVIRGEVITMYTLIRPRRSNARSTVE